MIPSFAQKGMLSHFFSFSFISGLAVLLIFTSKPAGKMNSTYTLLCLGDSYTVGESVPPAENFPNQAIQLLRQRDYGFESPELVAKTGWTTDELQKAIDERQLKSHYDFVTLLIGVNDQYRGRPVEDYQTQFESLLKQAIHFAQGRASHVIVLSIPDWGVTPFAKASGRKQADISKEIDAYNAVNREISDRYHVNYINITPATRMAVNDASLIARDGLHPSCKEYAKWAEMVSDLIMLKCND